MQGDGHPWARIGPGTLAGRYLRRWWQPVYRASDLVAGPPVALRALGEDWVLWRGAGGPRLVQARCPHRNTALALGTVEGDSLRCPHHGWRFDGAGACVERPGAGPGGPGLDCRPVREHLGLIFAWFGSGAPPPLPRLPAWEAPGVLRVLPPEVWPCGFFQRLENSCDFAHLPHAHRASGIGAMAGDLAPPEAAETDYGLRASAGELPVVHLLMPNALVFATPISEEVGWRDHLVWRVPLDDHRCASFSVALIPASVPRPERFLVDGPRADPLGPSAVSLLGDEVLAGRRRLADLAGTPSLTEVEDYVALVGQGEPAGWGPEALGPMDRPVAALRALWRRELAALEGGGALRDWAIPDRLD